MRDRSPHAEEIPEPMRGAWHLDAHRGTMERVLPPAQLVSAVFRIPRRPLQVGDDVSTGFGRFHVDALDWGVDRSSILLHTWAPGSVSRFSIAVDRNGDGRCIATLLNTVHPSSALGRLYFRLIELGHHVVMEIALRRLASAAR